MVLQDSVFARNAGLLRQGRYLVGRKPPRKSDTSVCWLQLMMCSRCPRSAAAIWHTVVLPVPVSPTSRHGSL